MPNRAPPPARRRHTLAGLTLCCAAAHAAVLLVVAAPSARPEAGSHVSLSVRTIELPLAAPLRPPPDAVTPPLATAVPVRAIKPTAASASPTAEAPVAPPTHLQADGLDMPPLARSAPDASLVEGVAHSGVPIRLRLYIEADGSVSSVEVRFVHPEDQQAAERLAAMFTATGFLPGRLHGRDVASFIDIEVASLPRPLSAGLD
jgi:hypothetical protein